MNNDINQKIANLSPEKRALLELKLKNRKNKNKNTNTSKYQTISPRENRARASLSFAQQRLWFLDKLEPNSPFYNIPKAVKLSGELDIEVLQRSLDAIVDHHEILRTNYRSQNGNPIQVIAEPQAVQLPIIDLQQYGQVERESQIQKLLQQESQRPFDLASDIMLRGCLIQLAPQEQVLLLVMHHIASDGWSMGILWEQLTKVYQAFLEGKPNPLPPLPIQYADYAVWQRNYLSGEVLDNQLNYWKQQLADANPVLELSTDFSRPAVQTYRGARQSVVIPEALTQSLQQLCRREGVTLYMSLLAAFQTLLYRYSRQEDIIVGSPIAGRNRAEIEELIGFFVNTLVLRTDLSGNPSFQELLGRVRSVTLDAYSHQDLPFEKLVEELNPERSLSYSPLFQVMFVLQNTPGVDGQLLGLTETPMQLPAETAKFDLTLSVTENNGTLVGLWNYNTDLFDAATITRMTAHFQSLLEAIVEDPQQAIAQLPLLTKPERHQLLVEWNNTQKDYPQDKCIHQLFEEQVERTPDGVAVVFEDQQLTYRELNERANQLAHYLQKLGVKPDMLVGIYVERSLEMIIGLLGILKAGGAYVPIDPNYSRKRLAFILEDTQASMLLTQEKWLQQLPNNRLQVICLDSEWKKIAQNSRDTPVCEAAPDSLIYVIYTSGSTGQPKGVMISHRGICNMLYWKQSNVKLSATDKVLQTYPFSFDASVCQIFWPLCFGGQLIVASPDGHKDTAYLVKIISEQQITIIGLVPFTLRFLLEEKGIENCKSLKHAICGGEPLGIELVERFYERLNLDNVLQNEYGPTEASMVTSYWNCQLGNNYTTAPIGRPIDNFRVYILDKYLQPVPIGQPGELHIGGVGLATGYLNRPKLTTEKFIPNPFSQEPGARLYKTGDLGRYLPDGNIEFLGRVDRQVKIRGFRIELGEIETVLAQHSALREVVVIAREDLPGDKQLVAYVVAQPKPPVSSELRFFAQERLPSYMVPSAFVFLNTMPLTPNGKVNRHALPAPDQSSLSSETDFVLPRNSTEEIIANIWGDVLNIKQVGIYDNFFDLGGHSLLATRLVSRCRQNFSTEISLQLLFENLTVATLAQTIIRSQNQETNLSEYQTIPRRKNRDSAPLSFAQQRLWFLDQLEPNSPFYNIPKAVKLSGELDIEVLQRSLDAIVSHHEILRTNYRSQNGNPIQVIAEPQAVTLQIIDLQLEQEAEREVRLNHLLQQESQRPFNLESDMMLRGCLVQLSPQEQVLLLVMHHIASDGWSRDILWQQLTQVYQAYLEGQPNPLAPLPVQYADYAVWQRDWLSGEVLDNQLNYWKQQLADANPVLELPTDFSRPAVQTYHGARQSLSLSIDLSESLRQLCRNERVTLYMMLLTAFVAQLHKYAGQEDILIGSPIANRSRIELEPLIGLFLNTIVLRVDLSQEQSFHSLLTQVRKVVLDAFAHQDMPFEKLVEELQLKRDISRNPLFQVLFNMLNLEDIELQLPSIDVESVFIGEIASKFDLTLYVAKHDCGIKLTLVYNVELFAPERMEEMLNQYRHLLSQIVAAPDKSVSSYSLVTPESKSLLPNPRAILPEPQYEFVTTMFTNWANRTPEQTAICQGACTWNYSDLYQTARTIATILLTHGIQKGDTVAVFGTRSFGLIASMMGVFLSGGVLLNIDPKLPSNRQQIMLQKAQAKYLLNVGVRLTDEGIWKSLIDICIEPNTGNAVNFERDISQITHLPEIAPDDPAYIFFTSGTTGVPKAVIGCHKGLSHFLTWQRQSFAIGERDRIAQLTALSFDVVLRDIFLPLTSGATLCLPKEEDILEPRRILSWLEQEQISAFHTVPSLAQSWLTNVPQEVYLHNLRWLFFAGEPLQEALISNWRKAFPQSGEIVNLYGPTETTLAKCCYQIPPDPVSGVQPVGSPLPETQALVLRDNNLCGIGEEGEIVIRTPFRTLGYLDASENDLCRFVQNPFRDDERDILYYTGDRGRYRSDGSLEILGRLDRQVKIRGVRIELREIESVISQYPDVLQCEVIADESNSASKRLIAYIVARSQKTLTNSEIRNFLKQQLPEYMIPSSFMFLETMPLTPNGKVDRKALPVPTITVETEASFAPPTEEIELKLTEIWSEVLDNPSVGIEDNFFDLGGHSLLAVNLFAQIEKKLDISLPLSTLFTAPTIKQLADIIRNSDWTAPWHSLVPIQTEGDKPPLFCVHGGGFNVLIYRELALNLGSNQPVYGLQAKGLDGKSTPHSTIEDMAADYVRYIKEIQPEGPYFIGGLSNGGRIALEMAQQLHKQNQEVALLAMFDTHGPGALKLLPPLPRLLSTLSYAMRYSLPRFAGKYFQEPSKIAARLSDLLDNHDKISQKRDLKVQQDRLLSVNNDEKKPENYLNEIVFKFHKFILNHSPVGFYGQNIHVLPEELQKKNQIYKRARKRYVPQAYSGQITVFQACEQPPGFKVDAKFGWGEIAKEGLEIYRIPGHHTSIVGSPELAKKLAECIAKAL